MKKIILLFLIIFVGTLCAEKFDIKKFSDPNKYGWDTYEKFLSAREDLQKRNNLLQIYETQKQKPIKNVMKSVIVPGWGHFSAKHYWKGQILLGLEIVLLGTSYLYYDQAMDIYDKYEKATYIGDIEKYYSDAKSPYNMSQVFLGLGIIVWVYNIYDTIVVTEKYNDALWEKIIFENQDTSISISPTGLSMRF